MTRFWNRLAPVLLPTVLFALNGSARADDEASTETTADALTVLKDDANLHDVRFLGRSGWAVGDHGAIWHSADGGGTWELQQCPVDCTLWCVHMITERVGWIGGARVPPAAGPAEGVVLFTEDGGQTWQELASGLLPPVLFVKFFNLEEGVVVGEATPRCPTGIATSQDGGKTWNPVYGPYRAGWRTADFLQPETGLVAGRRGQLALVAAGELAPDRNDLSGLRGIHQVRLQGRNGWLVGDGGLVLMTRNAGISWEAPAGALPLELRDFVDFRTVAFRGEQSWLAGQPGSVVWHTPDGGQTWERQLTGQALPIEGLAFSSDTDGVAVGAMGVVLKTSDGGRTWTAVRGAGRRLAYLAVHARPSGIAFEMVAKLSGDLGYRGGILVPARHDVGPDGHASADDDLRLADATAAVAGSASEIDWQFPLATPGLDRDREQLIADRNRRTEGKVERVFLSHLVRNLRMWRPTVVVTDAGAADDAATQLLNDALLPAIQQAADPTQFVPHRELAGLEAWRVERVYRRLAPGSTGGVTIDPMAYLPRLGQPATVAAAMARGKLREAPATEPAVLAYEQVVPGPAGGGTGGTGADFFAGLAIAPGSQARRFLLPVHEEDEALRRKVAERERNFRAYADRLLGDDRHAEQVLAQLGDVTSGMPDRQAALQLAVLADRYRENARWDLAAATLVELVERYPHEPAALDAMRWLLQFWASSEIAWQRSRAIQVAAVRPEYDNDALLNRVQRAFAISQTEEAANAGAIDVGPDPVQYAAAAGRLQAGAAPDWRDATVRNWHEQAVQVASWIRKKSPALYASPEVQLPLAAVFRARGLAALEPVGGDPEALAVGDAALAKAALNSQSAPTNQIARCRLTAEPPVLDALLSDPCWQAAEAVRLQGASVEGEPVETLAMFAFDARFLYVGASLVRHPSMPPDRPRLAGRSHDADLRGYDRLDMLLDVDRDYTTWYTFQIDQRGSTAEACWDDATWNPKWYAAADRDDTHWRVELAIPLEELVPHPPQPGNSWALGLMRTLPAVGVESWTPTASTKPLPGSFGVLRFE